MNVAQKIRKEDYNTGYLEQKVEFDIEIFESMKWKERYLAHIDDLDDYAEQVLMVRMRRVSGNMLTWMKIKRDFLLSYCSTILRGLPQWARNLDKNKYNVESNYEYQSDEEGVDSNDYCEFLLDKL